MWYVRITHLVHRKHPVSLCITSFYTISLVPDKNVYRSLLTPSCFESSTHHVYIKVESSSCEKRWFHMHMKDFTIGDVWQNAFVEQYRRQIVDSRSIYQASIHSSMCPKLKMFLKIIRVFQLSKAMNTGLQTIMPTARHWYNRSILKCNMNHFQNTFPVNYQQNFLGSYEFIVCIKEETMFLF